MGRGGSSPGKLEGTQVSGLSWRNGWLCREAAAPAVGLGWVWGVRGVRGARGLEGYVATQGRRLKASQELGRWGPVLHGGCWGMTVGDGGWGQKGSLP